MNDADAELREIPAIAERTKWWVVSALLHGFGIAFAMLLTVTIAIPVDDKPLVLMTELHPREERQSNTAQLVTTAPVQVLAPREDDPDLMILNAAALKLNDVEQIGELDVTPQSELHESLASTESLGAELGFNSPVNVNETLIGLGSGLAGDWESNSYRSGGTGLGSGRMSGLDASLAPRRIYCMFPRTIRCFRRGNAEIDSVKWLAAHQEPDGSWDARKHGASVKTDTAVTGLALLTLLAVGNTERFGEHKENVRRAVAWLKRKQDADGMIWDTSDDNTAHRAKGYPCAIASLALIEAAGMANLPETRAAAQKALDYICNVHHSSTGGWGYAAGSPGDLSVTGWFVMALKSAKVCGFTVPRTTLDKVFQFLDSVEVKEPAAGNEAAYSRYKYSPTNDHLESAHRLTAIGTVSRQMMGLTSEERDALDATVAWYTAKGGLPAYGANGEKVDLYYWYYATLGLFMQGNRQQDLWTKWATELRSELTPRQCKSGDDRGSWDPVGAYANEWGRVGQTALSTLCIATWYRYQQIQP